MSNEQAKRVADTIIELLTNASVKIEESKGVVKGVTVTAGSPILGSELLNIADTIAANEIKVEFAIYRSGPRLRMHFYTTK